MSEVNYPFIPPSFNTLVLFSVTPRSQHMVTAVNNLAADAKRLTINSWWYDDDWLPSFEVDTAQFAEGYDDWMDYFLEDYDRFMELTADQSIQLERLYAECNAGTYPEGDLLSRCQKLHVLHERYHEGYYDYNEVFSVQL